MHIACSRYENLGRLTNDKCQPIIIAYSHEDDSKFKFPAEDKFEMANPLRAFRSVDVGLRFARPELSRWKRDGKIVNRCQKPLELLRWVG